MSENSGSSRQVKCELVDDDDDGNNAAEELNESELSRAKPSDDAQRTEKIC